MVFGSSSAKAKFREKIGFERFVDVFRRLGEPSRELLTSLVELAVEDEYVPGQDYVIENMEAVRILLQWLPHVETRDKQTWLAETLQHVCCCTLHNRMQCCSTGVLAHTLSNLQQADKYDFKTAKSYLNCVIILTILFFRIFAQTVDWLIVMLTSLGSLSITCAELKQLIRLLKVQDGGQEANPHTSALMNAMCGTALHPSIDHPAVIFTIN